MANIKTSGKARVSLKGEDAVVQNYCHRQVRTLSSLKSGKLQRNCNMIFLSTLATQGLAQSLSWGATQGEDQDSAM